MTLFALASEDELMFREALDKYCNGTMDPATIDLLRKTKAA
jgi:uncharacterized protein (DUF1810 family)